MLADSQLQRVPASREHADRLILQARMHLVRREISEGDPAGGYTLVYDAARKALTAVLENQGLRPTSSRGHLAVYEATRAQLDPPMGYGHLTGSAASATTWSTHQPTPLRSARTTSARTPPRLPPLLTSANAGTAGSDVILSEPYFGIAKEGSPQLRLIVTCLRQPLDRQRGQHGGVDLLGAAKCDEGVVAKAGDESCLPRRRLGWG